MQVEILPGFCCRFIDSLIHSIKTLNYRESTECYRLSILEVIFGVCFLIYRERPNRAFTRNYGKTLILVLGLVDYLMDGSGSLI